MREVLNDVAAAGISGGFSETVASNLTAAGGAEVNLVNLGGKVSVG